MIILDTNVVSELRKPRPHGAVLVSRFMKHAHYLKPVPPNGTLPVRLIWNVPALPFWKTNRNA